MSVAGEGGQGPVEPAGPVRVAKREQGLGAVLLLGEPGDLVEEVLDGLTANMRSGLCSCSGR